MWCQLKTSGENHGTEKDVNVRLVGKGGTVLKHVPVSIMLNLLFKTSFS